MSVLVDIADAVVAQLNGHTFPLAFTAQRAYAPLQTLKDLQTIHVTVVPKGIVLENVARDRRQRDYQIDIAVQKKLASLAPTEIDPLVDLAAEIGDLFVGRLASYPGAIAIKTEHTPIYALEHLEQLRTFTGVLTVTFRVVA